MRRRVRILLAVHELWPGAPSVPLYALEELNGQCDVFTVAFGDGPLKARYAELGPLHIVPPSSHRWVDRGRRTLHISRLELAIKRLDPDVIYANSVATLHQLTALRLPDRPRLLHVHELDSFVQPLRREHPGLLRDWPTRLIAVSNAVRRCLVEAGVAPGKVQLLHEFIPDASIPRDPQPPRHAPTPFVVGGAGRVNWRKGVTLWLQTAAVLKRRHADLAFQFRWVGMMNADHAQALSLEVMKLGLDSTVAFIPQSDRPAVEFAEFDAFVMSSWEDPCPLVVLENMALGKPVLCFRDGGGAPEQVAETGIVVDEFDPYAMADAIAALASDPSRVHRLGAAARERVRTHFTARSQAPKLLSILEEICSRRSPYMGATPATTPADAIA